MLVEVLFRELAGRVLGGMQFGVLFEVLVMAQAHSCKIDGRMQFGVLMQLFWGTVLFRVLFEVRNFRTLPAGARGHAVLGRWRRCCFGLLLGVLLTVGAYFPDNWEP